MKIDKCCFELTERGSSSERIETFREFLMEE